MKFIQRHMILDYPEYWFEIDEYQKEDGQQVLFAHLRCAQFNKSILQRILIEWRAFRTVVTAPLFAFAEQEDAKWKGFVSLLGFKPTAQEIVCNNGAKRQLYISVVKDCADVHGHQTKSTADYVGVEHQ